MRVWDVQWLLSFHRAKYSFFFSLSAFLAKRTVLGFEGISDFDSYTCLGGESYEIRKQWITDLTRRGQQRPIEHVYMWYKSRKDEQEEGKKERDQKETEMGTRTVAELGDCLSSIQNPEFPLQWCLNQMQSYTHTQEVEASGREIQRYPWLHRKF